MFRVATIRTRRVRATAVAAAGITLLGGISAHAALSPSRPAGTAVVASPAVAGTAGTTVTHAAPNALPSPLPSLPVPSLIPPHYVRDTIKALRTDLAHTLHDNINPDKASTFAQTIVTGITASPSFASDHTVFAQGFVYDPYNQLPTGPDVLWVSHDGGTNWALLASTRDGFGRGQLLLPPSYPTDPAIFVDNSNGLFASHDGGHHFIPVVPEQSPAAMDPTSPPGDARILLGGSPVTVYHAGSHTITLGPPIPPQLFVLSIAYVGDGQHVVAAGGEYTVHPSTDPNAVSTSDTVIETCNGNTCSETYRKSGGLGGTIYVSPTASVDHTLYVFNGSLLQSTDGGLTFAVLPTPTEVQGFMENLVLGPDFATTHEMLVQSFAGISTGPDWDLYRSTDGGQTLTQLPHTGVSPENSLPGLALLPNDEITAGNDNFNPFVYGGVLCSTDHGQSFSRSC